MRSKKINLQDYIDLLLAVLLIAVPFVNISKGLDYTDTGYSLMCFQNFLDARGDWSLCMYAANFLGFVFMHLPGGSTLLGMRIYCTLVVSALNLLSYRFFVYVANKERTTLSQKLMVCLGICLATFLGWCPHVVLYNYLGYFLTALTMLLLYKGLSGENGRLLLAAGLVLSLNTFTRLPNAMEVLFIISVFVYDFCMKKKPFDIVKDFYNCLVGYLAGFVILMVLTMFTHGYDAFVNMVNSLLSLTDADYGYSGADMFMTYPLAIMTYGKWIGFFALIVLSLWAVSKYVKNVWIRRGFVVAGFGAFAYLYKSMHYWGVITAKDFTAWEAIEFFALTLIFATFVVCVIELLDKNADAKEKFLASFIAIYLLVLPIGTNTKYKGVIGALFIVLPYLFVTLARKLSGKNLKQYLPLTAILSLFVLVSTFQFAMSNFTRVYADMASPELTSKESHIPSLKNEKLLPGMVGIIDGLYDYLKEENLLDTPLLTWGDIPSVCFYMGAPSALSNAWPDLTSYREEDFLTELDAINPSPIIINRWFSGGDPLDEAAWQYSAKAKDLAMYMELHGYSLTFENDKFRVYLPEK